eukprot:TRINITY_DN67551_c2_g1_i1.p1 TRINITY_DN67551_c2_g1~~TRINITY_DN67551_c2_g1_i1.p1  ORF type:complete len:312 (-),score=172.41 TRINITY_DN67551_c2_g1_i1:1083-2018(-)
MSSSMSAIAERSAAEADLLCVQAEKKLQGWSLFNKAGKHEAAGDLYSKAASKYKIAKNYEKAAEAFQLAAGQFELANCQHEAKTAFTEAAKAFKMAGNNMASIKQYDIVATRAMENNKFSQAARYFKEMAQMYEAENKLSDAMNCYRQAGEMYQAEDSQTSANQMYLKVADHSASTEDYKTAIQTFESVAEASMDNNLTKWSAKEYLFKAALCQLAYATSAKDGKVDDVRDAVNKYKEMLPQFDGSRECKLIESLLDPVDKTDVDAFTDAVFEYDSISKLDNWKASLLLKIKLAVKNAVLDIENEDDVDIS